MAPHLLRRVTVGISTAALCAGLVGALSTGSAGAAPVAPSQSVTPSASTAGGAISKTEILQRMKNWFDRNLTYSQTGPYAWDIGHTNTYRRDCSGFASMAMHMKYNWNTDTMATDNKSVHLVVTVNKHPRSYLSPSTITTGDMFIYLTGPMSNHHMFVFAGWNSDHKHFTYYSFGQTPVEHLTGSITDSTWAYKTASDYKVYRYSPVI